MTKVLPPVQQLQPLSALLPESAASPTAPMVPPAALPQALGRDGWLSEDVHIGGCQNYGPLRGP